MTTHADILGNNRKCCCIRHEAVPSEVLLLENLLMLFIILTVHFACFTVGWNYACYGTLIMIYYSIYQIAQVYCKINKCYLERLEAEEFEDYEEAEEAEEDQEAEEAEEAEEADDEAEEAEEDQGAEEADEAEDQEAEDEYADMPPLIGLTQDETVVHQLQKVVDETNMRNVQRAASNDDMEKKIKDTMDTLQNMIANVKAQMNRPELIPEFKKLD